MSRRSRSNSINEAGDKHNLALSKTDEQGSLSNLADKPMKKNVSSVSLSSAGSGKTNNKRLLLSATDPDTWVNKSVTIIDGKYDGMVGTVLRSGNGWVQVEVDGAEVPKRAYELEVERDDNTVLLTAENNNNNNNKPNRNVQRKTITSISYSEAKSNESSNNHNDGDDVKITADAALTGDEDKKSDMKISIHLRQAKRLQIQKYVDRHQETIKDRPDLTYWLHQINGIMVDNVQEAEMSRNFIENKCHVCNVEKWPESKFCWNRACKSSPIFYNHDGSGNTDLIGGQNIYYQNNITQIIPPHITELSSPSSLKKKGNNNIKSPRSPTASMVITNTNSTSSNNNNNNNNNNSNNLTLLSIDGAPMLNSVTDFLIYAPAQIIGYDYREKMKLDLDGNSIYDSYVADLPTLNNINSEKYSSNSPKKKMKL